MPAFNIQLPDEVVEAIARRAAEIVAADVGDSTAGYLDVTGAAEFIAAPASRIYALVSARRIPHHKDGARLLFDRGELRTWVEAGGGKRP